MKNMLKIMLVIAVLSLQIGCSSDTPEELRYKYHQLEFNMLTDDILQLIG